MPIRQMQAANPLLWAVMHKVTTAAAPLYILHTQCAVSNYSCELWLNDHKKLGDVGPNMKLAVRVYKIKFAHMCILDS
jgi:hypothetical protein